MKSTILYVVFVFAILNMCAAGPIGVGICYAGCAGLTVACFSAAGFTFGKVDGTEIVAVPALAACNSAFAACEAACMAMLVAPTP